MPEASAHLLFCLLGCFLAVLVAGTAYKQEGGGGGAADCRLQPSRLSTSVALLRDSQSAAATRVTPEERGLTRKGANGVCRRVLALGPDNAFSRESGEKSSLSPRWFSIHEINFLCLLKSLVFCFWPAQSCSTVG